MLHVASPPAYREPLRPCAPLYPPPYGLPSVHSSARPHALMATPPDRHSPSASTPSPNSALPLTSHTSSTASSPSSSPSHSLVHLTHLRGAPMHHPIHGTALASPAFPLSSPYRSPFDSPALSNPFPFYPLPHSHPPEPSMSDDEESVLSSVDSSGDNGADGLDFNSSFPSSNSHGGGDGGLTSAGHQDVPSASTHHRATSGGAASAGGSGGPQRVPKACSTCRKRKRRCDGQQPCSSCNKANKPAGCSYQQGVRRRGPQAGMVQRLRDQVKNLQAQLEHVSAQPATRSANGDVGGDVQPSALSPSSSASTSILSLFHQDDSARKVAVYRGTFFRLINDTLFPMLVQSDFDGCYEAYEHSLSTAPSVWHLTLAAVLANGAYIWGDFAFAAEATEIARAAAAPLFDQPSAEVIRGLLVLAYHCLSDNALSKSSCYLATITRMCDIVDMPAEVPLLTHWLEDILCASRTFALGLRTMPEGSYQAQQRTAFPNDWSRYERLVRFYRHQAQERNRRPRRGTQPSTKAIASGTSASGPALSSAASSITDFTAPPDARDLDDRNIRWELLQTLCAISESKGEYNRATPQSVYHHLCVLTKAEQSPLTAGLLMSTIAFCKSQALFFVNEQAEAVEMARTATKSMLSHDVHHCAFYALQLHFVSQVHLRMNDFQHLAVSLSILRTVGRHWKFGLAPLRHIEQVIQHAVVNPSSPFIPNLDDASHAFEPVHMLPPEDRQQAESFYHSSLPSPAPSSPVRSTDRELSPRSFAARSAQLLALLQHPGYPHPNISDTINSIDSGFPYAFHPPPTSVGIQSRTRDIPPAAPSPPGREEPPPSHSDAHPHPHLFSLRPPPNAVPIRLKREDIQITPDAFTRATTQPSHVLDGSRDHRDGGHVGGPTPAALPGLWVDRRREVSSPAVVQRSAVPAVPVDSSGSGYAMSARPLLPAVSVSYTHVEDVSGPFSINYPQSLVTTAAQSQQVQYDALLSPALSEGGSMSMSMFFDHTAAFPSGPSSPFLTPPSSATESALLSTPSPAFLGRHLDGLDVGPQMDGQLGMSSDAYGGGQGRAVLPHPHGVITLSHFPPHSGTTGTATLPIAPFAQVPRAFTPQPPGLDSSRLFNSDPTHRH